MFDNENRYRHYRVLGVVLMIISAVALGETKQEKVHRMSKHVMPFDMSKTIHIFEMTTSGGIQSVLVRESANEEQVGLIREHLRKEAKRFRQGDYSDPGKLHGEDMPGLAELQDQPSKVTVSYAEVARGAKLTFEAENMDLITAIHRWFGAQLNEHADDARAK